MDGELRRSLKNSLPRNNTFKKLTDKIVAGVGGQLALEGRDSIGIRLGAIAGETPVAVEAGKRGIPSGGLFEKFRGFGKLRVFGAHDADVVVGAGEDFGNEGAVL